MSYSSTGFGGHSYHLLATVQMAMNVKALCTLGSGARPYLLPIYEKSMFVIDSNNALGLAGVVGLR